MLSIDKIKNLSYKLFKFLIIAFLAIASPFYFFSLNTFVFNQTAGLQPNDPSFSRTIIVFGAGVRNKKPTLILRKRLDIAVKMYRNNLIDNILVSGDNQSIFYNEPLAMLNYLLSRNVSKKNIFADYGGRNTIDTCLRAKFSFKISNAYIATQDFHLPRAIFLCQSAGLKVRGVTAANPYFVSYKIYSIIREIAAFWKAFMDTGFYELPVKPNGTEPSLAVSGDLPS